MRRLRAAVAAVIFAAAVVLAFPCAAGAASESTFTGRVVGVHDGDTFTILHDGKGEKVRVNGIDCPELGQPFGSRAKQYASELIFGKYVTVTVTGRDRYGRTLGDATLADGRTLSRELVGTGLAWWYRQYSNDRGLETLEAEARTSRRGLWADVHPTAPWEWRRASRGTSNVHAASSFSGGGEFFPRGEAVPAKHTGSLGRITGERMPAGQAIYQGPKGGRYYYGTDGKKIYVARKR